MSQKTYYHNGEEYYQVSISRRGQDGKRIRKKARYDNKGRRISSKQIASKIEYQLRKEVEVISKKSKALTWEKWHHECLRRMRLTLRESTTVSYENGLEKWLSPKWREKNLVEITKDDVFELIFEYIASKDKVTKNIQKSVLQRIRRLFEMAIEDGILNRNPTVGITIKIPPPERKVFNSNEANILLKAAKDCNHRFYYHWALALFTGMRNGELYALRWPDVDFETGLISVSKQWTSKDGLHPTKSYCNRVVPICKELKKLLLELKERGPFQERFWPGISNTKKYPPGHPSRQGPEFDDLVLPRLTQWRHGEQAKFLRSFCENLGIEGVKFHDLRATIITNMLAQGVPLVKVMAIVGHAEMSVTNDYLRLAGVDVKENTTDKLGYYLHDNSGGDVVNLFQEKK